MEYPRVAPLTGLRRTSAHSLISDHAVGPKGVGAVDVDEGAGSSP